MRNNNCLGVVFCNSGDDNLAELTALRTMGSVPFGCRYRIIDFALSMLVNAGISKVGIVTKRNFQSLSDHVGNGRPWDLARKMGGLYILSPFSTASNIVYKGKIDALYGCIDYFNHASEEYVVLTDANLVSNIDLERMIDEHKQSGADISIAYKKGIDGDSFVVLDNRGKVTDFVAAEDAEDIDTCCLNIFILNKELLIELINEATLHNYTDFSVDVLQRNVNQFNIRGFEVTEYASVINSMQSYFDTNMALLDKTVRDDVFNMNNPVYTKVRDDMPSRYGFDSNVDNSLIADGCLIEGEVKNSIIFRGVHIAKGAKVENCILMQSAEVGKGTNLQYVVADKNVTFKEGRTLVGCQSFPLVISKGLTV